MLKRKITNSVSVIKSALLRWLSFGLVIFVLLFVTLKWDPIPEMDMGVLKHICESSPIFKPPCSCGKVNPFQLPVHIPESKSTENVNLNPHERRHIAFVKTHKAASSTVLNILYRFARDRDLVVLLPKNGNYLEGRFLNKTSLLPPPEGKTYDILCNHAIFNHTSFSTFLPSDTVYMGIVREPFQRFLSAFFYFRYIFQRKYLIRVPGGYTQILKNYLMSPWTYEPKNPMDSMTNNRMAIDFGFPPSQFHNESVFDEYLLKLNNTFTTIIVCERFDESMVLVKRLLNWTMREILYTIKNKARIKARGEAIVHRFKKYYAPLSQLDRKLYEFSVRRLNEQIAQQGPSFQEEVKRFRAVRQQVAQFCSSSGHTLQLTIPKNEWSDSFTVTRRDCTFLNMQEIQYLNYIRNLQIMSVRRLGVNAQFWGTLPG